MVMMGCCFVVERDALLRGVSGFGIGEVELSTFDVLQMFVFFLQMGFTLILATLDGLDVCLLGDVIGEDDGDEDDESLGAQEDASKQGRSRIEAIDRDAEVTLVETQRRNGENDDNLMFDTGVFDGDEIVVETEEPMINVATTTKSIPVSIDEIDLAQEITLAQALATMKSAKTKEKDVVQESSENQRAKGIAFREPVESTVTTTVPSQKSKDKGKAIMIELEKPLKKKEQIELDEELAREIEAEKQAKLERIQIERAAQEEKAKGSSRKKSIGRKRAKDKQEQESSKRQRVEDDKEEEELKKCFELAKEEEITINVIPLATKVPVVGFQIHTRGKPGYYEIFRADGSSKLYHARGRDFEGVMGDLRVMLKPDVESKLLNLYKDTIGDSLEVSILVESHFIVSKQKQELMPFSIFTKLIVKRPPSFHHVIKLDSTLGNLKFVNKGSKEPIFGRPIIVVMLNDDIKAFAKYLEYLAKSRGVTPVKTRGKGLLTKQGVEIAVERVSILRRRRSKIVMIA
ncbi:hypothetical protein Tco_0024970 [Tanacetum coccineum]